MGKIKNIIHEMLVKDKRSLIKKIFYEVLDGVNFRNPHTFIFDEPTMSIDVTFKLKGWVKKSLKYHIQINLDENGLPNGEFVVTDNYGKEITLTDNSVSDYMKNNHTLEEAITISMEGLFLLYINNISY
jgi:hypothetical protein